MASSYDSKVDAYFDNVRFDVAALLPARVERVLEVGCGRGATLAWLKAEGRCTQTVGIELFEGAARVASRRVDEVLVGDAERLIEDGALSDASFDLVLCLDVLEHLVDPWTFVQKLQRVMKPGALLVTSIPNVRHLRVVLPLLFAGRWRYEDDGLLDRTHLRFFTRDSALALVSAGALRVERWHRRMPPPASKAGVLNLLSLGLLRDLVTMSYLIASRKGQRL